MNIMKLEMWKKSNIELFYSVVFYKFNHATNMGFWFNVAHLKYLESHIENKE